MPILLVGLNHSTTPVDIRERVYIGNDVRGAVLERVCALDSVGEAVVLSTCNRTELYLDGAHLAEVEAFVAERARLAHGQLRPYLYRCEDERAVGHLFRVACGLDSEMLGETQILGQIRDALETARHLGAAGGHLTPLFQQAVAVGKRARTETAISEGAFSVGRAAVEFARGLFPDLCHSQVLLLGAGKMSELTAKHLAACGARAVFVANRTYAHARDLAERLGGVAIHYQELAHYLTEVDVLISSTGAPHLILGREEIAHAMARRGGRPMCLIDIAVPRDIDPAAAAIPGVHLYNVDDLQEVTAKDRCRRAHEVPKVETLIAEEVERWRERQASLEAVPIITALRASFEEVRRAEVERLSGQLAGLAPEQRQAVETLTTAIINKLLHTPTVRLKDVLAHSPERLPLAVVSDLFALEEEAGGEKG